MLKNHRQLTLAKKKLAEFEERLSEMRENNLDDPKSRLHFNALEGLIEDLKGEIHEYKFLISDSLSKLPSTNLNELGKVFIQVRIARKLTQGELAERINVHEQQIQRYEKKHYDSCSLGRLLVIAKALDVNININEIVIRPVNYSFPDDTSERKIGMFKRNMQESGHLLIKSI